MHEKYKVISLHLFLCLQMKDCSLLRKALVKNMYRKQLEATFCWKISGELKLFKYRVLRMEKEEIFGLAYRIDCILRIYEILIELSRSLSSEELEGCIRTAGLLDYLFDRWLKVPDTQNEELEHSLCSEIRNFCADAA